jgi:hypothetical protein
MKKALFIIKFSCICALTMNAQDEPKYKWHVSAAINSVEAQMDQKLFDTWIFPSANYYTVFGDKKDKSWSFSLIPKYEIKSNIYLRIEIGMTNINLKNHYYGNGDTLSGNQGHIGATADITKEVSIQQKIYRYAAGLQYNFLKNKFIETYCGISLYYLQYSEMHWIDHINDNTQVAPNYNYSFYRASTPGGFATGVGALAGFNIFLYKGISLGGEFSYSLLYHKLGGVQNGTYERYQYISSSNYYWETHLTWSIHNNKSEGIQFSKIIPCLNLTIRF